MNYMYHVKYWAVNMLCSALLLFILDGIGFGETLNREDKIDAQALWTYITVGNPYQNYPTWPGKEGFYESTMPPGNILKLYINDLALDTVMNKKGVFPEGALLIKENYTDDKKIFFNYGNV